MSEAGPNRHRLQTATPSPPTPPTTNLQDTCMNIQQVVFRFTMLHRIDEPQPNLTAPISAKAEEEYTTTVWSTCTCYMPGRTEVLGANKSIEVSSMAS